MLGVYVTVPVACFRKGLAREYLETEPLPPPATCYGFLLSLVGETDRRAHVGCRVAPVLLGEPPTSVVLRTKWRLKNLGSKEFPVGIGQNPPAHYPDKIKNKGGNVTVDYQQLLAGVKLVIWLDSADEPAPRLEDRVRAALADPQGVTRFGGLSLGESTHLVDEVCLLERAARRLPASGRAFLLAPQGRLTLPVWIDHVGSAGTRYATGDLEESPLMLSPPTERLPRISPE